MTLLAAYHKEGIPVLLADVLISQLGIEAEQIDIPTRDDVAQVLPSEWMRNVCSLYPKLSIINPGLAIGWTGRMLAAKKLVESMRSALSDAVGNIDRLSEFLKGYREEGILADVTVVGLVVIGSSALAFKWVASAPDQIDFGNQFFEGTGSDAIANYVEHGLRHEHSANADSYYRAVQSAITMVGNLVADDLTTGTSIQNLYGGGYQIVVYRNGLLSFVDDYLILFVRVESFDARFIKYTPVHYFLKHKYVNDCLVITRVVPDRVREDGIPEGVRKSAFILSERRIHDIRPMEASIFSIPQCSAIYCIVALYQVDKNSLATQVLVTSGSENPFVKVESKGGSEQVYFSNHYWSLLRRSFHSSLGTE